MQNKISEQYKKRFNVKRVNIIKDIREVKIASENEDIPHIQLVAVKPYFDVEERQRRKTEFMKRTMVNSFYYEIPLVGEKLKEELMRMKGITPVKKEEEFTKKKNPGLHEVGLIRTIFRTESSFPSFLRRSKIIPATKREIILSPANLNAQDLEKRTEDLRNCIEPVYDDKVFLPLIQGAVATQV
jgi:hypothetical protein